MTNNPVENKRMFSDHFYNKITYVGMILTAFFGSIELLLFILNSFSLPSNVLIGGLTYVIIPIFVIGSFVLIPFGAIWKWYVINKKKKVADRKKIYMDLSKKTHVNGLIAAMSALVILLMMTMIGTYNAFQYTESNEFCGQLCHAVMEPEYVSHENSAHANIKCAECHIGEGVDWYIKSKISGMRQLLGVVLSNYPKPVPSPVHNLRPANDTCEKCHWPNKFYSSFDLKKTYYPKEEGLEKSWVIRMLVKVGSTKQNAQGIHAHMFNNNKIYYVADDEKRQQISWVKSVDASGKETIYLAPDSKYNASKPSEKEVRNMDCIDCHNRPTHQYKSPQDIVNLAIASEKIKPVMPNLKNTIIEVLTAEYKNKKEAASTIKEKLTSYYKQELGSDFSKNSKDVEKTVDYVASQYTINFFPEMKAVWSAYPDNIGHLNSAGCFRCHDGQHKSADGKVISRNCNSCHIIIEQGGASKVEKSVDGLEFKHPFDGDETWKETGCYECHTGE